MASGRKVWILRVITDFSRQNFFYLSLSHQHCKCYMVTFQLYWWRMTSSGPPCIISGMSRHLSRTNGVPYASFLTWKNPMSLEGFKPSAVKGKTKYFSFKFAKMDRMPLTILCCKDGTNHFSGFVRMDKILFMTLHGWTTTPLLFDKGRQNTLHSFVLL